jgi:hypothetical protein
MVVQGLRLPPPVEDEGAVPAVSTPVRPAAVEVTDEMHLKKLREFFRENKPENVPRVEEFFQAHGREIWTMLTQKYPGKTDSYLAVGVGCRGSRQLRPS